MTNSSETNLVVRNAPAGRPTGMAGYIEVTGKVVAVEGEFIWVQTQPRSSCSSCNVGSSCGTSLLARWFGKRTDRIRVHNALGLHVGQEAVVGIQESALLKASMFAYVLPILAMVAAAIVAAMFDAGDGAVALWSLAGLGVGLVLLMTQRHGSYQPVLLRKAPVVNHLFNIEVHRGTTS